MPRQAVNNVTVVGHVADEPKRRGSGERAPLIIRMGIPGAGNKLDETGYFNVVVFGDRAAKLESVLKKGSNIAVAGSLRKTSWEYEGSMRTDTEIIASDLQFTDTGRKQERSEDRPREASAQASMDDDFMAQGSGDNSGFVF